MSYILDALKKSERERTLGNIPTLESGSQAEGRRVPISWFITLLVALVAISALFWIWSAWRSDQSSPEIVLPEVKNPTPEVTLPQVTTESGSVGTSIGAVQISEEPAAVELPQILDNAVESIPLPAEPVSISELDQSVRSRLPEMSVNVLSYSDSKLKRFIMINQNIYKEGAELGGGIVIEEIEKSRAILSFEGTRFIVLP